MIISDTELIHLKPWIITKLEIMYVRYFSQAHDPPKGYGLLADRCLEVQMQTPTFWPTMSLLWFEPTTQNHSLDQMSSQISRIFSKIVCGQSCVSCRSKEAILTFLLRWCRYSLLRRRTLCRNTIKVVLTWLYSSTADNYSFAAIHSADQSSSLLSAKWRS